METMIPAYDPAVHTTVRLDEGLDGHGLTFELVLLDGHEDDNFPTSVQIEDSQAQIALAKDFGFDPENAPPSDEGEHGQAYDFLKANIGQTIPDPGYFNGPDGPYEECDSCGHWHRKGYGGECRDDSERFIPTGDTYDAGNFGIQQYHSVAQSKGS